MSQLSVAIIGLGFLCVLSMICTTTAQTGVCYISVSTLVSGIGYVQSGFNDRYGCGFRNWRRCRRTLYRSTAVTTYSAVYNHQFGCCSGYEQSGPMSCRPVCSGGCANGGTCIAPNRCSCLAGWIGSDCRTDADECASPSTNNCEQMCINNPGSYTCNCNTGFRLNPNGRTCAEIHECDEDIHLCDQNCHNTVGSYTCSCNTGYTLSSDGRTCINDDECVLGTDRCVQNCHDTPGSYTCSCRAGYILDADGYGCNNINECELGTATCGQNCHDTVGTYTCSCNSGYTLNANARICDDNDECSSPDTNNCHQRCVNLPGSYSCECFTGYSLNSDQRTCRDINECIVGTDNCYQVCHNNVGSFTCTCNAGSTLASDGYTCHDINECASRDTNYCQQVCNNTQGSYRCDCNPGYVLNADQATCSDVNECYAGTDRCSQYCWNIAGSYTCSCGEGYTLNPDGMRCDDIDECTAGTHQCVEICVNLPGTYNCTCRDGYQLTADGFNCTDIDECAEGTSLCAHDQNCTNTIGSHTCSCGMGYIIDVTGYACDDIDECGGAHMCAEACNNTAGSFHCACLAGYILNTDGRTCRDLDECAAGVDECDQNCHNNVGSYTCSCNPPGFTINFDGFRCDDINECLEGSIGNTTCLETCVNTPGSWRCGCSLGYTFNIGGRTCRDLNECTEGGSECDQQCYNSIGSYNCSCNSSTTLNADGFRCDDINECWLGQDNCAEICVNTYGTYYCACNPGYTINTDGVTCGDANECVDGTNLCEQFCTNTNGSYMCSCDFGYSLTSNFLSCLGPPEGITFGLIDSSSMTLTWGTPRNDSNDGSILNYRVDCSSDVERNFALLSTIPADAERQTVLQNLRPYTSYNCCVSVVTDRGASPFSCIEETTLEEEPSNPPQNTTINNDDTNSLTFNLQPPVVPNGIIIAYTFYITFENGSSTVLVDIDLTGTFMLEGLLPYQLVTVEVSANTSAGEGPRSAVDEIRTAQAVPSVPTGVLVDVTSNRSITVGWDPPIWANGILLNYTVRIYNWLNEYSRVFSIHPYDTRSISVDDLDPFIPYTVEITASTVIGEGGVSTQLVYTEHGVPNIPTILNVIRISEGSAKVFWIPLTPDEARGVLTQLQIAYQPALNGMCNGVHQESMQLMTIPESIDTQFEAVIDGLGSSDEYCVAIQVSTRAGESGYSNTLKAHYPSDVYMQIHLKLSENEECSLYIAENTIQKASDISSAIVQVLLLTCSCPYSLEYVAHTRLLCGTNQKEIIYQANLLNTDGMMASNLKDIVQLWVDNSPRIPIAGTSRYVDSYCHVNLTEIGNTADCVALNPTTPTVVESTGQAARASHLTAAIAGGVGGGVGTIIIVVIVIGVLCSCRRKTKSGERSMKNQSIFDNLKDGEGDNTLLIGHTAVVSNRTPADYGRIERETLEFSNPVYNDYPEHGVYGGELVEEVKRDFGITDIDDSEDEDIEM